MKKGLLSSIFVLLASITGYVVVNRYLEEKRDFR